MLSVKKKPVVTGLCLLLIDHEVLFTVKLQKKFYL